MAQPQVNPLTSMFPFLVIFFIFYFLLIRPQQKKEKERQKMIAGVKKDDQVITSGGIYGTVVNVQADSVELKVDDNTKIRLAKNAITTIVKPEKTST